MQARMVNVYWFLTLFSVNDFTNIQVILNTNIIIIIIIIVIVILHIST
jgi:hypothetical protein